MLAGDSRERSLSTKEDLTKSRRKFKSKECRQIDVCVFTVSCGSVHLLWSLK